MNREDEEQLELADIQGDVIIGLQKDAEIFVGFAIEDVVRFKRFLAALRVTSCLDVKLADRQIETLKKNGGPGRLDIRGVNIGFTFEGLKKLGAPDVDQIADGAFREGLASRSALLNDPPEGPGAVENWLVGNGVGPLDGMILLTGKDMETVRHMFGDLDRLAGPGTWLPFFTGEGETRPNDRGHEHFGFLDGVSQPAIRGRIDASMPGEMFLNESRNPEDPNQGLPGADLHWPGEFVFGYRSQLSTDVETPGPTEDGGPAWMRNGSFMVFRRLEQLVPEFAAKVAAEAPTPEAAQLLGARMVGRFKSGWPVVIDNKDDPAQGADPMKNNDFEFVSIDPNGASCPFAAHIRKSYPRDDATPGGGEADTQTHRIFRAGIPFGPEVKPSEDASGISEESRGLMFVCYQTSIEDQFEFITRNWINNPDFAKSGVGVDPILGQAPGPDRTRVVSGLRLDPITFEADFIRPTGGGYFFIPSLSAISSLLSKQFV